MSKKSMVLIEIKSFDMNYRILVIDDMESIHEDFKKILTPSVNASNQALNEMNNKLFDHPTMSELSLPPFIIDSAFQGQEGVRLVKEALNNNLPYAIAFVDVIMPPGEDGIETIHRIWEIDEDIQTVICTAYTKYTWEDIQRQFGSSDRLFIIKKPFDNIEILQLATVLTKRWNLNQSIKDQLSFLQNRTAKPSDSMEKSLDTLNSAVKNLKKLNEKLQNRAKDSF